MTPTEEGLWAAQQSSPPAPQHRSPPQPHCQVHISAGIPSFSPFKRDSLLQKALLRPCMTVPSCVHSPGFLCMTRRVTTVVASQFLSLYCDGKTRPNSIPTALSLPYLAFPEHSHILRNLNCSHRGSKQKIFQLRLHRLITVIMICGRDINDHLWDREWED